MTSESVLMENLFNLDDIWIFGYGSLIWKPGFKYAEDRVGYVKDFSRKLWQGNVTHRGLPSKPGRVATLIESKQSRVWGKAFHVVGRNEVSLCLEHLGVRECLLGGYYAQMVEFIPQDSHPTRAESTDNFVAVGSFNSREFSGMDSVDGRKISALAFVADPSNLLYMGPATAKEIANCLLSSEGASGKNLDYMLGILEFLKYRVPVDELVFEDEFLEIEQEVWMQLQDEESCTLAGCHGFYLEKKYDQVECSECVVETNENEDGWRKRVQTFSPLLETVRRLELRRDSLESSWTETARSFLLSELQEESQGSRSDDETDSCFSTSPPGFGFHNPSPEFTLSRSNGCDLNDNGYFSS